MSFTTKCPRCPTWLKVPNSSRGSSFCCPRCYASFIAFPAERPPPHKAPQDDAETIPDTVAVRTLIDEHAAAAASAPAPPPSATPKVVTVPSQPDIPADTPMTPISLPATSLPDNSPAEAPAVRTKPRRARAKASERVNLWVLAALALAGASSSIVALGLAHWLSVFFAAAACVLTGAGTLASLVRPRAWDRCWLGAGIVLCSSVLLVALFRPQWLNPRWEIDVAAAAPDPNQLLLVDIEGHDMLRPLTRDEWVNPDTGAIRLGDVDVRIDGVRVAPLSWDEPAANPPPRLAIALRIANSGFLRRVIYQGLSGSTAGAVVRDNTGKACARIPGNPLAVKKQVLAPGHYVEDLLVFEPVPATTAWLDLEIAATAWGGEGACRFRIAQDMIVFSPPAAPKK